MREGPRDLSAAVKRGPSWQPGTCIEVFTHSRKGPTAKSDAVMAGEIRKIHERTEAGVVFQQIFYSTASRVGVIFVHIRSATDRITLGNNNFAGPARQ